MYTSLDRTNLEKSTQKIATTFGNGGLSGKPIKNKSTEIIQFIKNNSTSLDIIASGGILPKMILMKKGMRGLFYFKFGLDLFMKDLLLLKIIAIKTINN